MFRACVMSRPVEHVAPLAAFDYDTPDGDNDHTAVGSYC